MTTAAAALVPGVAIPARAAVASSGGAPFVAVHHLRVLDAKVKARSVVSFSLQGVPATGVSAVVLSVSVATPAATGALVAYPAGAVRPGVLSLSFTQGRTVSATVVVAAGSRGRAALDNASARTERVAATVLGYYAQPGTAAAAGAVTQFVALPGKRLKSFVLGGLGSGSLVAAGKAGVPTADLAGVLMAVTVVAPARSGALVLYPAGRSRPKATSLSFTAGRSTTGLVLAVPGSQGRVDVASSSAKPIRVYADVVGYLVTLRVPSAPRSVSAVGSDGSATVSWVAPIGDGGTPVTGYRVVAQPGGPTVLAAASATSAVVGGLADGSAYTFAVAAVNSRGAGPVGVSGSVTPFAPPSAPSNLVAVASGVGQVSVSWTAAASSIQGPVTGYRVSSVPGGAAAPSTGTSAVLSGLTSGQFYSFTATATNAAGVSPVSAASNTVTVEGTSRVSVSSSGVTGGASSTDAAISADGRYVAFDSAATNLVPQPTTGENVYVRDRLTDTTTLVSVAANGTTGANAGGNAPSISADGRYVVFQSTSTDLTVGDTNGQQDVFVRDLQTGTTRIVSKPVSGQSNGFSASGEISADGTAVVFISYATNLLAFGTTAGINAFVANLASGAVTLVSVATGSTGPSSSVNDPVISADGRYVAFDSRASNLVASPVADGKTQVFVSDVLLGGTTMLTKSGTAAGDDESFVSSISDDGRYVAFYSDATNLVTGAGTFDNAYTADRTTGDLALVTSGLGSTPANNASFPGRMSSDDRYLAVQTDASNMVPGDPGHSTQVVRFDLQTGARLLVSVNNAGVPGSGDNNGDAMSADGKHVAWTTDSTNLVAASNGGFSQLYAADLG